MTKQNQKKEDKIERINTCNICGKPKKVREFYKSPKKEFQLNGGVLPYCKSCLKDMCINENKVFDINKFIEMLQFVDRPFIRDLYDTALKDKRDTVGAFFSLLSMNDKKELGWKDSDEEVLNPNDVNDIKMGIKNNDVILNDSNIKSNKEEPELDGIELQFLQDKWGEDLPIEQLVWMDRNYKRWENDYAIGNELDETIIQQIVFEKWYIKQDRQEGKPVDKRIETMNKLIKQGNFKKRSAEDSEINSIAEYIAEWEKGKPFLKESNTPEFKDPDNFIKLGVVLAGAIARTQGKNNKYVEEFEDYYKNVTMDLTNLNNASGNEGV